VRQDIKKKGRNGGIPRLHREREDSWNIDEKVLLKINKATSLRELLGASARGQGREEGAGSQVVRKKFLGDCFSWERRGKEVLLGGGRTASRPQRQANQWWGGGWGRDKVLKFTPENTRISNGDQTG